jgi:hypothetical protein
MSPSEVEELVQGEPFRPFRMTLASGDQITVESDDRPFISGLALVLRGSREDGRITSGSRFGVNSKHRANRAEPRKAPATSASLESHKDPRTKMKAAEIEGIVHAEPFRPYRLVLSNGEEVVVRRPRKSHVSGDQVALVGLCRRAGSEAVERFRLIDVGCVIRAETVDARARP